MNERLEMLSEKVRRGQPIDFNEAIEVIDYQEQLKQERKANSFVARVRRFFGVEE
jgi:hypothetical protein